MPLVTISSNIVEGLKRHGVVPDVVDEFSPRGLITVSYGGQTEVTLGNTLKVSETQKRPVIHLTFNEDKDVSDYTYTLVVTDPDAPTRGDMKWSEYCHYVVTGIKSPGHSAEVATANLDSANELVPYLGPAPPPKTGKHRYVFILYREGPSPPKTLNEIVRERANWGTGVPGAGARGFAKKYGLTPVAINFFFAQDPDQAIS